MVTRNDVLKQPTKNLPLCSMLLLKVLNSPKRSSGRVGLFVVCDSLYMGIDNARLPNVGLKTGPAFTQVVPQASKPNHGFGGVWGEVRSQIANGPKMLVKSMRVLPTSVWWRVSPVQTGCIRDHAHGLEFVDL